MASKLWDGRRMRKTEDVAPFDLRYLQLRHVGSGALPRLRTLNRHAVDLQATHPGSKPLGQNRHLVADSNLA